MKYLILAIFAFSLSGCISFPASRSDLVESGRSSEKICSAVEPEIINETVESYLRSCFLNKQQYTYNGASITTPNYLKKDVSEDKTEYVIYSIIKGKEGYMLGVDVLEGQDQCETEITGYAYNFIWARHFSRLESIANQEEANCPF